MDGACLCRTDYDPDDGLDQSHEAGQEEHKSHRKHNQGVEGPSQIRYIHYMEAMLYKYATNLCAWRLRCLMLSLSRLVLCALFFKCVLLLSALLFSLWVPCL